MKWYKLGACAAVMASAVLLPNAARAADNDVRIGVIAPTSGGSADFGESMRNGVQLALEEINASGGYLGRKLVMVERDDQANPDIGRKSAEELVSSVVATIGYCNTGVALKSLEVFQKAKAVLLVPCATGSKISSTYPAAESYIFHTSASDNIQIPYLLDDLLKKGLDKVAVFADSTPYGDGGVAEINKNLAEHSLKPVYVARFPLGVKSLQDEMGEARAAGANVIIAYAVGPEQAVIADSRAAAHWNVPHTGPWPISFPYALKSPNIEGALTVQTFIPEPINDRRLSFLSAYTKKFNAKRIAVPMAAAQAYDSTFMIYYALFGIKGELNGTALKNSLENMPRIYYGVVTTYEKPFSAHDHDAITRNMLVMGKAHKGEITFANEDDIRRTIMMQHKQK